MHRRVQAFARRHIDKAAVLEEGRIERRKRVVFTLRLISQMFLDVSRIARQRRSQAADNHTRGLRPG